MSELHRLVEAASRRLDRQRWFNGLPAWSLTTGSLALLVIAAQKLLPHDFGFHLSAASVITVLVAAILIPWLGASIGIWRRRTTPMAAAAELDRRLDAHARVATALAFSRDDAANMQASARFVLADAERCVRGHQVSHLLPLRVPRWMPLAWAPTCLAILLASTLPDPLAPTPSIAKEPEVSANEREEIAAQLAEALEVAKLPLTDETVAETNALLDSLLEEARSIEEQDSIDRTELLARTREIRERLEARANSMVESRSLRRALTQMSEASTEGPGRFSNSDPSDSTTAAIESLQNLATQLSDPSLTPEEQAASAETLRAIADQLDAAAETDRLERLDQELQLESAIRDGDAARASELEAELAQEADTARISQLAQQLRDAAESLESSDTATPESSSGPDEATDRNTTEVSDNPMTPSEGTPSETEAEASGESLVDSTEPDAQADSEADPGEDTDPVVGSESEPMPMPETENATSEQGSPMPESGESGRDSNDSESIPSTPMPSAPATDSPLSGEGEKAEPPSDPESSSDASEGTSASPESSDSPSSNSPMPGRNANSTPSQEPPSASDSNPPQEAATPNPSESNPSESNPSESNPSESNPSESNPSESNPSESNPSESNPSESNPSESNPSESNPSESNPSESNPSESNPSESNPSESNPSESPTDPPPPMEGQMESASPSPSSPSSGESAREAAEALERARQQLEDLQRLEEAVEQVEDIRRRIQRGESESEPSRPESERQAQTTSDASGAKTASSATGSRGQRPSDQQGQSQGTAGAGQNGPRSSTPGSSESSNGAGQGSGRRGESPDEVDFFNLRNETDPKDGESIVRGQLEGPNRIGPSNLDPREAVRRSLLEDAEPISEQKLPRSRRNQVRDYFERLREGNR